MVKPLRKISNSFVVSLAFCDLFQNLCVKPFYVHTYIYREWESGPSWCVYALFASNLAILESMLHVSAIAFHRYVILVHRGCTQRFQGARTVVLILMAIYLLPPIFVILPSIGKIMGPVHMGQEVVFNNRIMFCSFVRHTEFRLGGVLKKVLFIAVLALVLLYFYVHIYIVVRKSGRSVDNTSGMFSPTRLRREWTLLKTIMVIFATFTVSYLPISILYGVDTNRDFPYWVYLIGVIALWSSSSINWLIYGLMNKQYLRAYEYVLCRTGFATWNMTSTRRENGSISKSSITMSVRNGHVTYHACASNCGLPPFNNNDGDV